MAAITTVEPPCTRCAGQNGAHYLSCPSLRLAPGWHGMAPRLTSNQAQLLALLEADGGTLDELAARWPSRSRDGIRRTADSLADLGLIAVAGAAGRWAVTTAGRAALEAA